MHIHFLESCYHDLPLPLQAISTGKDHTCAIDINQNAWCFGDKSDWKLEVPGNKAVEGDQDNGLSAPGPSARTWLVSVNPSSHLSLYSCS